MKRFFYQLVFLLILTGCRQSTEITPTSKTPGQGKTLVPVLVSSTEPARPSGTFPSIPSPRPTISFIGTPTPTSTQSTTTKTNSPTLEPTNVIKPAIHGGKGENYSVLFSIPVGEGANIKYRGGGDTEINGPNAIAVLPDNSILIADIVGNRLLRYDQTGQLLKIIDLELLGIFNIVDMRVKADEIYLLEIYGNSYRVIKLNPDGNLISTDEFPPNYPIGVSGLTLANVLTGITIDCEGNILLEAADGSEFLRLVDVMRNLPVSDIVKDYICNGRNYRVVNPGPKGTPKVVAGNLLIETQLTNGLGGFRLLDILDDGGIYIIREDVVDEHVIKVDQTLHFLNSNGQVRGMARIPSSEFLYYVMRSVAIESTGEILALFPRQQSIDIIRLNFYTELESLVPNAITPNISACYSKLFLFGLFLNN